VRPFLTLALTLVMLAPPAFAQAEDAGADDAGASDAGLSEPDAGPALPDASVGTGCADCENPEAEDGTGRTPLFCRSSADCERGFQCQQSRCTYVGFQRAESSGCTSAIAGVSGLLGLVVLGLRRRPRR
jgi:hypothetical protein